MASNEFAIKVLAIVRSLALQTDLPAAISLFLTDTSLLLNADRCTLFLVERTDSGAGYLYVGLSKGAVRRGDHKRLRNLRIPVDRSSIVGYCALSGEVCNVPDAYADNRFDKAVDVATGYHTRSILAVPLKDGLGNTVAVMQVINKMTAEEVSARAEADDSEDEGSGAAATTVTPTTSTPLPATANVSGDVSKPPSTTSPTPTTTATAAATTTSAPLLSWPTFTADDAIHLVTLGDVAGAILQRLTLQALASRERSRSEMMIGLMRQISTSSTSARLTDVVSAVIDASFKLLEAQRVTLFLVDESRSSLVIASSQDVEGVSVPITKGLAGYCATTGMPLCIADAYKDPRFDPTVDAATGFKTVSVLCVPIRDSNSEVVGVLQAINRQLNGASPFEVSWRAEDAFTPPQFSRGLVTPRGIPGFAFESSSSSSSPGPHTRTLGHHSSYGSGSEWSHAHPAFAAVSRLANTSSAEVVSVWPFTTADVDIFEGMAAHAAVALRSAQLLEEMTRAQKMTGAVLDIVQSTASESTSSVSQLVQKIVDATYTLLDCERVTLYLVDTVKQELWMAVAKDSEAVGARIPIGQGLAGYVARTGIPLNIPDAHRDARFDPSFDMATGYRTQSVLVWPIAISGIGQGAATTTPRGDGSEAAPDGGGSIIAVLQAINKRSNSIRRVASTKLLKNRLGSLFGGSSTAAGVAVRTAGTTGGKYERKSVGVGGGGATTTTGKKGPTLNVGTGAGGSTPHTKFDHFDANDERILSAFCAEVAIALKRRSVEAAFMKVLQDSAGRSGGVMSVPDELNVSLLALYTDAGTSARLHTSVLVRRMSVERTPVSWASAIRLISAAKGVARRQRSKQSLGVSDLLSSDTTSMTHATTSALVGGGDSSDSTEVATMGEGVDVMSSKAGVDLPDTSALSLQSAKTWSALDDELLEPDNPLLTWNWDVFHYPITALPNRLWDPVLRLEGEGPGPGGHTLPFGASGQLFDVNDVMRGEARLLEAVVAMFRQFALLRRFRIDETKFAAFVQRVRQRYHPNAFHNFYHAVSVLHASFLILGTTSAGDMLSFRDILGCMLAAYGHDVDHPGHNNAYEVNSYSPLALTHNDDAVLERHHAHTLFATLFEPKCDILCDFDPVEMRAIRHTMVNAILHTDMTKHFSTVANLADRATKVQEQMRERAVAGMDTSFMEEEGDGDTSSSSGDESGCVSDLDSEEDSKSQCSASVREAKSEVRVLVDESEVEATTATTTTAAPAASPSQRDEAAVAATATATNSVSSVSVSSPGRGAIQRAPHLPRSNSDVSGSSNADRLPGRHTHTKLAGALRTKSSRGVLSESGSAASQAAIRMSDILPFDRTKDEDRNELVAVIVHTADLSGQAYPRAISNNWNARILAEFRAQANKEKSQGLPVAPFMANLDTPLPCARLQLSFVANIVLPLWLRVSELLPGLSDPIHNLNSARLYFEAEVMRLERQAAAAVTAGTSGGSGSGSGVSGGPPRAPPKALLLSGGMSGIGPTSSPLVPPRHIPSALRSSGSITVGDAEVEEARLSSELAEAQKKGEDHDHSDE